MSKRPKTSLPVLWCCSFQEVRSNWLSWIMSSTNVHSTDTMRYWMKRTTNATFGIDKEELGSGRSSQDSRWRRLHICKCFSEVWSEFHRCISEWFVQCDIPIFSDIFRTPQTRGNKSGFLVPVCPYRCAPLLSPANYDMLNLVGSDREFLQISFWDISSVHCGLWNCSFCASVSPYRAPRAWGRSSGLRKRPVAIGEKLWLDSLFFQEVSTSAIDNSLIPKTKAFSALYFWNCFAYLEQLYIALFTNHHFWFFTEWVGRRYFVANRLEVLVDEDDSGSSSRVREHWSFLLVSQLCRNPDTLKSMSIASSWSEQTGWLSTH